MYQNKYPKMIISIGIYSINRPEAGYGRGGVHKYIYAGIHTYYAEGNVCVYLHVYMYIHIFIWSFFYRARVTLDCRGLEGSAVCYPCAGDRCGTDLLCLALGFS